MTARTPGEAFHAAYVEAQESLMPGYEALRWDQLDESRQGAVEAGTGAAVEFVAARMWPGLVAERDEAVARLADAEALNREILGWFTTSGGPRKASVSQPVFLRLCVRAGRELSEAEARMIGGRPETATQKRIKAAMRGDDL